MYLDGPKSPADLWSNEDFWPREDKRFYFIARALGMIGRSLFGDEWTGREGHIDIIRPLPEQSYMATDWEKSIVSRMIKDRFPDAPVPNALGLLGDTSFGSLGGIGVTGAAASYEPDHWQYARDVWQLNLLKRQLVIDRKRAVSEWIVEKAHDEKTLRMVAVDRRNLQPFQDLPENWNLKWDKLDYRWKACAYAPAEPNNPAAIPTHDIFVFREDLDRLLASTDQDAPQGSLQLSDHSEAPNAAAPETGGDYRHRADGAPDENEAVEITSSDTGKERAALRALSVLHPEGIPPGLPAKVREKAVNGWLETNYPGVRVSLRVISSAVTRHRSGERA